MARSNGPKSPLPSDRKFLRARMAEQSLGQAIFHLRNAVENLSSEEDMIASDACRKALVKATTAHSRARGRLDQEKLRVAPQLDMEGVR